MLCVSYLYIVDACVRVRVPAFSISLTLTLYPLGVCSAHIEMLNAHFPIYNGQVRILYHIMVKSNPHSTPYNG